MANIKKSVFYILKFILLFISLFFGFVSSVYALNVTLQWIPNSEPNLAGYRVFYRTENQSYNYESPYWETIDPTCIIYDLDETKTYYFVVRAFDTEGFESADSNEVILEAATTYSNQPPIAVIVEDYIEVMPGTTVTLDGSRSTDADDGIASYQWIQVDGSPVILSNQNSEVVTFTAPETDQYGSNLTFQLTVTDFGGLQGTADCFVYVTQDIPTILNSVTIIGSTQVNESLGAQYTLRANYSDGSSTDVTDSAGWSENSGYTSISSRGYLTASAVTLDQSCTITASYEGQSDTHNVTIKSDGEDGGGTPAITSPASGSTLSGSEVTFSWSANGTPVSEWWLVVSTSPSVNSYTYDSSVGTSTSKTVSGLPTDGKTVYVTLYYRTGGSWEPVYYQYTAYSGDGTPAITSPAPGSTLSGSEVTFSWSANGASVSECWLKVGTHPGISNIHDSGSLGTSTSKTVSRLPTDGSTVHLRLWYMTGGSWKYVDAQYTTGS